MFSRAVSIIHIHLLCFSLISIVPESRRVMMKFSIESTASYNSIHPTYHYTEQFANNGETYREGTRWYGVFLAFLSGTFFTISAALVKAVRNVDPMILLAIRALLQILAMAVVACRLSGDLFGPSGRRILIHFQVTLHSLIRRRLAFYDAYRIAALIRK